MEGSQSSPEWWTGRSQKGAGPTEAQRGPESLWATFGAWWGSSCDLRGGEEGWEGIVGRLAWTFISPLGQTQAFPSQRLGPGSSC